MSKTLRTKVTLKPGEAAVVWDIDTWYYLAHVFNELAGQYEPYTEEHDGWHAIREHLLEWVDKTAFYGQEEEDV